MLVRWRPKRKPFSIYGYEHLTKSEEDIIEDWLTIQDTLQYVEEEKREKA